MSDSFQYLNLNLDWPGFTLSGLEKRADGSLTLSRVPKVVEELITEGAGGTAQSGAAGIATTADCACDLYISDPANHRLWRFDVCANEAQPLPYLTHGSLPGELDTPRGLAIAGGRLYVAESGNHRIQVIDLATQQSLAVWGQPNAYAAPTASADPGRLNDPWGLAADADGNLYVADHGNKRVQKFAPSGAVIPSFWEAAGAGGAFEALTVAAAGERVYALAPDSVRVFALDGTSQAVWALDGLTDPLALAVADAVYIGGADGTIAKYSLGGQLMSILADLDRPIAALTVGCNGELLAGSGGLPVIRLRIDEGYTASGSFQAGPFEVNAEALAWQRLRVFADAPDEAAHLQLFTYTSATSDPPSIGAGDNPYLGGGWIAAAADEFDTLILNGAVRGALSSGLLEDKSADTERETSYFWVAGVLRGEGAASPVIRQLRIDYSPETSVRYLPAIYREGARRRLFLELMLAAFGSELGGVEDAIGTMARLFDPAAAPAEWLPWLAGWVDFELIESWPPADKRRFIAEAVQLYTLRGTAEGLRRYLKLYAGVEARIEEPGAQMTALFALDERVSLGFNTVLAPAHEQGAVLDSTATLEQSHLLDVEQIGAPLFLDAANRFSVEVYAAQVADPGSLDLIARVLEREKPAHTDYQLCVIDAAMRVGLQARLGIDSIVAGPALDLRLGDEAELGRDSVLTDQPHGSDRRLGYGGIRLGMAL